MSFEYETEGSSITPNDGKVQNLSQSRVQYALSAFKTNIDGLNWVNIPSG